MALDTEDVLEQIDDVLASTKDEDLGVAATRLGAAIERLGPPGSKYRYDADAVRDTKASHRVGSYSQILRALRGDVRKGYIRTLEESVHEAVFDDFLEMAEHLVELDAEHGPSPAVVLAGAVLEEHVRKLASKHEIEVLNQKRKPRSFEELSEDLVRKETIRQPERKIIAGWYGQRTEAAHGRFENVVNSEVPRIVTGVREFIVRHPA